MQKKKKNSHKQENIWNVPNMLTSVRIILTLVLIFMIFSGFSIIPIIIIFSIAMITDFLDGQIARRCNLVTEFGRKFDILADRFLLILVVASLLLSSFTNDFLSKPQVYQIFMILSREILAFPFALLMWLANKPIVHARFIGKLTTFLQGFALPSILLSSEHHFFSYAPYLSIVTFVVGVLSGLTFIRDLYLDTKSN